MKPTNEVLRRRQFGRFQNSVGFSGDPVRFESSWSLKTKKMTHGQEGASVYISTFDAIMYFESEGHFCNSVRNLGYFLIFCFVISSKTFTIDFRSGLNIEGTYSVIRSLSIEVIIVFSLTRAPLIFPTKPAICGLLSRSTTPFYSPFTARTLLS